MEIVSAREFVIERSWSLALSVLGAKIHNPS